MIKKADVDLEELIKKLFKLSQDPEAVKVVSELKHKIERYEALIDLGQLTASSLDYKVMRKKAVKKLKVLLECEHVIVFLKDEKKNCLFYESYEDRVGKEKHKLITYPIDDSNFAGSCAYHIATLHFNNMSDDIRFGRLSDFVKSLKPENTLLVPLVSNGEVLGVIQGINSNHGDFNTEDYHFAEAVGNQLTIAVENALLFERLNSQFIQVISAMADAIGKKDSYTGGHTKRVGLFAEMIAQEMELPTSVLRDLKMSAVLHDIGKIGIEDKILKKSSPLTDEEFAVMREHPRLGFEILGHIESLSHVIDGMRYHHERPDGKGYPFGLKGDEIPLIASIISVADTYDAMISTRPYRKGLPTSVAYDEILKFRGIQFDEKVVDAFSRWYHKSNMSKTNKLAEKKKAG